VLIVVKCVVRPIYVNLFQLQENSIYQGSVRSKDNVMIVSLVLVEGCYIHSFNDHFFIYPELPDFFLIINLHRSLFWSSYWDMPKLHNTNHFSLMP